MRNSIQSLLNALRVSFSYQKTQHYIENSRELYRIAKENGVSGTIYKAVKNRITNMYILNRFRRDFYKYIADDQKKLDLIDKISVLFVENNIDHIYLKGAHLKHLYQETYMRSMGDIDVLVKNDDMEKAEKVLKAAGFDLNSKGPVHNVFFYGELEVELHRKLVFEEKEKNFGVLSQAWDHVTKISDNIFELSPEYELLYLLYHNKKHLLSGGIGLRNVIDIGIFLNKKKDQIDYKVLHSLLEETQSILFFKKMVIFNDQYLRLHLGEFFHLDYDPNKLLYKAFTNMVIQSGVHGYGIEHNPLNNVFAGDNNQKTSKLKSILRLVFPSYQMIRYKYPKMLKNKIFLPIAWIRRIINIILRKTKKMFMYFKLVKESKLSEIMNISKIFNEIGI